jgi:hypothetical protein
MGPTMADGRLRRISNQLSQINGPPPNRIHTVSGFVDPLSIRREWRCVTPTPPREKFWVCSA